MRHNSYTLRTVFGYYPTPEGRSNRPRFCKKLSSSQYSLLVGLIDWRHAKFEKGATEANAALFGVVYRELPESAAVLRDRHFFTDMLIAAFSDSDYNEVRALLKELSELKSAGYFTPSPSFKIPPHLLKG